MLSSFPATASGRAVASTLTVSAPFTVGPANYYDTLGPSYGCARATLIVPANFSGATGIGRGASGTSIRSCPPGRDSLDFSEAGFRTNVSVSVPSSSVTFTVNWSLRATLTVALQAGYCHAIAYGAYCYQRAEAQVKAALSVEDLTTGRSWGSYFGFAGVTEQVYNDTSCLANCTHTHGGVAGTFHIDRAFSWAMRLSGLLTTDRFAISLYVLSWTQSYTETGGAAVFNGFASAISDMATGGDGMRLRSVAVS